MVENRSGAGGAIGADAVAKSSPDGQTLLFISSSLTTNAAVQNLPYDPAADFAPVARVTVAPKIIVVGRDFPARTMGDLLAMARERPGQLHFGTAGPADTGFFAAELLKLAAGIDMEAVAYRGISDAVREAAAGRVDLVVTTWASSRALVEAGQLRILAVAMETRDRAMPDVPTVRESGVDYVTGLWWGILAPARTPAAIVRHLNATINGVLTEPDYLRILESLGGSPAPATPEAFADLVRTELGKWRAIADRAGMVRR